VAWSDALLFQRMMRGWLLGVVAAAALASCGGYTTSSAPGPFTSQPADPASLLAQRDGASNVSPYAAALDALVPKCTQNRVGIAGIADAGFTDLQSHGITTDDRLTVLQHLSDSVPAVGPVDCQGVMAAYLVLREK